MQTNELNKILPKYKKAIQTLNNKIIRAKKPENKLELTKQKKSSKNFPNNGWKTHVQTHCP